MYESSKNCLKLTRTVWHFQELSKNSENCLNFPRTVWGFRELFESPRTVWDLRELFESSENILKFPRTVWNFWELFKTFENCLTLSRTMSDSENTSQETMEENSGPSETSWILSFLRFWSHLLKKCVMENFTFLCSDLLSVMFFSLRLLQ